MVAVLVAGDARFEIRVDRSGTAERFRADRVDPVRLDQELAEAPGISPPERRSAVSDTLSGLFRTLDRQFASAYPDSRDSQGRVVFPWHRFQPTYIDREFAAVICDSLLRRIHSLPVEQFVRWWRRSEPAWHGAMRLPE